MSDSRSTCDTYTVGWVATLPCELDAAVLNLDHQHGDFSADPDDRNSYTLGEMSGHNVVIVFPGLGRSGIAPATHIVSNMMRTFRKIRFVLLVGIGGGAPGAPNARNPMRDIRLGDVVVGCPEGNVIM
jgi:nucleoside phosphorylase